MFSTQLILHKGQTSIETWRRKMSMRYLSKMTGGNPGRYLHRGKAGEEKAGTLGRVA